MSLIDHGSVRSSMLIAGGHVASAVHVLVCSPENAIPVDVLDELVGADLTVHLKSIAAVLREGVTPQTSVVVAFIPTWNEGRLLECVRQLAALASSSNLVVVHEATERSVASAALYLGADDFLFAPLPCTELVARIVAKCRWMTRLDETSLIERGDLRIDQIARMVEECGEVVELRRREFDLLNMLVAQPNRVFSRQQILNHVWQGDANWVNDATVTEHIRRLRTKLCRTGDHIKTVHGVGYTYRTVS